jgi:hypothetical protein
VVPQDEDVDVDRIPHVEAAARVQTAVTSIATMKDAAANADALRDERDVAEAEAEGARYSRDVLRGDRNTFRTALHQVGVTTGATHAAFTGAVNNFAVNDVDAAAQAIQQVHGNQTAELVSTRRARGELSSAM